MIITRDVAKWNDAPTLKPLYHNGRRLYLLVTRVSTTLSRAWANESSHNNLDDHRWSFTDIAHQLTSLRLSLSLFRTTSFSLSTSTQPYFAQRREEIKRRIDAEKKSRILSPAGEWPGRGSRQRIYYAGQRSVIRVTAVHEPIDSRAECTASVWKPRGWALMGGH